MIGYFLYSFQIMWFFSPSICRVPAVSWTPNWALEVQRWVRKFSWFQMHHATSISMVMPVESRKHPAVSPERVCYAPKRLECVKRWNMFWENTELTLGIWTRYDDEILPPQRGPFSIACVHIFINCIAQQEGRESFGPRGFHIFKLLSDLGNFLIIHSL